MTTATEDKRPTMTAVPFDRLRQIVGNTVTFTLPALPASVNNIYQIIWRQQKVELKPECRTWKSKAKEYVPVFKVAEGSLIRVDVVYFYDFFYKNGKLREFDTHNLMKLLIDAVASRLGHSDKVMKSGSWDSVDDAKERAIVTLTEYPMIARDQVVIRPKEQRDEQV
jgi:hypothetical protein